MKIGLVCPYILSRPGGVQEHIKALYQQFKRLGQEVKIIAPKSKADENIDDDIIFFGKSVEFSGNDSTIDISLSFKPFEVRKFLQKENFDILHFHNFGPLLFFQILEASGSVNILTLHSLTDGSKTLKYLPTLKKLLQFYIRRRIDGLILVSPVISGWAENFQGLREIIPNGVDLERFNTRVLPIEQWRDGFFNILFVGRIEKRKGLIYLLRAFQILKRRYTSSRLIIVGDGDQRENCESFVREKKLKEVIFVGTVASDTLPEYYRTADLFVSPAIHGESFGIVLLEAMASGTPIVAFANQGYQEVLKGKGEDCLVEPRNVWELTQKIERLIVDEEKRQELREWGMKEAKKYSWTKIAERVLEFYEKVLKAKGKERSLLLD